MSVCANTRYIASAGTGKTHQVVNLYLSLLLGRPYPPTADALAGVPAGSIFDGRIRVPPERILMLTFSRNAAAEMRTRVTEAIEKELATGRPDDEFFYWSLLRRLPSAVISTIHAFAQQLLGRNALRIGLAPHLTVIEGAAASELLDDAIATALRSALTGSDADLKLDLELLCDGRKVSGIVEAVTATIRLCAAWGIDLAASDPALLVTPPNPPTQAALQSLQRKVENAEWIGTKALMAMSDGLRKTCKRIPPDADPFAVSAAAAGLLDSMGSTTWGKEGKPLREEVKASLIELSAYPRQREATRLLVSFLRLVRDALRISQARKHEQGALDFDDLLFKARDLVGENPAAIPAVDVIIVDEAQDNSRLQNEFITLIQKATGASVVVCGDTKQTIYGWRGADPDGMNQFAETLKLHPVPLKVSYRSQSGILDWVNDIFARIMGTGCYDANAELLPCPAATGTQGPSVEVLLPDWESLPRPDEWIVVPPTTRKGESTEKPRFTITPKELKALAAEDPDRWSDSAGQAGRASVLEARALARRIKLLASPDCPPDWRPSRIWDSSTQSWAASGAGKPYRYRDVLVLLRTGTRQEEFEQALQEEGIPYTTDGKGRGFFTRQEVFDIAHLIQWLAFPHDDNSLVALFRSPLVGLTDSAIAVLSALNAEATAPPDRRPRNGRWLPLLTAAGQDTALEALRNAGLKTDQDTFARALPILTRLRSLAGRIHTVDLVREAVRLTGYDAILAGTFHGVQRLANLRKLLSWIQDSERGNNLDLQALAAELTGQITAGQQEPDAAVLDPEDDSVRINTVHAAKGLSSPVVIIPDLQRASPSDKDWILVARDDQGGVKGLTGEVKVSVNGDDDPEKTEGAGYEECVGIRKRDREEELKRVFYVACTRARDLLILSGTNPSVGEDKVWRGWINAHLEACAINPALVKIRPHSTLANAWRALPRPSPGPGTPLAPDRIATLLQQRPGTSGQTAYRFPATTLIRHLVETEQACSGHGARLELASVDVSPRADGGQDIADLAYSGTVAHRVLECLDYGSGISLEEQIGRMPEMGTVSPGERKRLLARLEGAAGTLRNWLAGVAPEHLIRELPFAARFTHEGTELIVDGKVDLLFLKDGVWHIVDYKFSDHDAETLKAHYALQLAVYRDALFTPAAPAPLRVPRFGTTARQAAPLKLLLLGIGSEGTCRAIDATGTGPIDIAPALIAAARRLQS